MIDILTFSPNYNFSLSCGLLLYCFTCRDTDLRVDPDSCRPETCKHIAGYTSMNTVSLLYIRLPAAKMITIYLHN